MKNLLRLLVISFLCLSAAGCSWLRKKEDSKPPLPSSSSSETYTIDSGLTSPCPPLSALGGNQEEDVADLVKSWSEAYAVCATRHQALTEAVKKLLNSNKKANEKVENE